MFEKIAQKISRKFSIVFGALTITVSASYLLSFWFNKNLKQDSIVLEIANTNRILSQQLDAKMQSVLNATNSKASESCFIEIGKIDRQMDLSIRLFFEGGKDHQLTNNTVIEKESDPQIIKTLVKIQQSKRELFHVINRVRKTKKFIANSPTNEATINTQFKDAFNEYLSIAKHEKLFNLNKLLIKTGKSSNNKLCLLLFLIHEMASCFNLNNSSLFLALPI